MRVQQKVLLLWLSFRFWFLTALLRLTLREGTRLNCLPWKSVYCLINDTILLSLLRWQFSMQDLSQVEELLTKVESLLVQYRVLLCYLMNYNLQPLSFYSFSCIYFLKSSLRIFILSRGSLFTSPSDLYLLRFSLNCQTCIACYRWLFIVSLIFSRDLKSRFFSFSSSSTCFLLASTSGLISRSIIQRITCLSTFKTQAQSELHTMEYSYAQSFSSSSTPHTYDLINVQKADWQPLSLFLCRLSSPSIITNRYSALSPGLASILFRDMFLVSLVRRILQRSAFLTSLKSQTLWRKLILSLSSSYLKCPEKTLQKMFFCSCKTQQMLTALALSTNYLPYWIFSPKCSCASIRLQNLGGSL